MISYLQIDSFGSVSSFCYCEVFKATLIGMNAEYSLKRSPKVSPEGITRPSGESNKSRSNKLQIGEVFHHPSSKFKDAFGYEMVGHSTQKLVHKNADWAEPLRIQPADKLTPIC